MNRAQRYFVQIFICLGFLLPKSDMYRDPNVTYNTDNAPKLLFRPDADFIFTTSIEHAFANKWDAGAIVLKQDSLNWVKFCFERDYTGANRVVSVVTKDISDDLIQQSHYNLAFWHNHQPVIPVRLYLGILPIKRRKLKIPILESNSSFFWLKCSLI